MKTSWSLTEQPTSTLVSPLANFLRRHFAVSVPRRSQMDSARPGWEVQGGGGKSRAEAVEGGELTGVEQGGHTYV